jgi:hypothetical protein
VGRASSQCADTTRIALGDRTSVASDRKNALAGVFDITTVGAP